MPSRVKNYIQSHLTLNQPEGVDSYYLSFTVEETERDRDIREMTELPDHVQQYFIITPAPEAPLFLIIPL